MLNFSRLNHLLSSYTATSAERWFWLQVPSCTQTAYWRTVLAIALFNVLGAADRQDQGTLQPSQQEAGSASRYQVKILQIVKPCNSYKINIFSDKQSLISDGGKLTVLDELLQKLKSQGHRVLIYSQMTKMIDLLEEFMYYRKHTYMRLDGSSKISERRDMVADFQNREDIFVFLLSTRAGGLGINLTAADTVSYATNFWTA